MIFPFMDNTNNNTRQSVVVSHDQYEYDINFETSTLSGRKITGVDALKVWIYKALHTQRYVYDIYTWDFGEDFNELIGSALNVGLIKNETERRIRDALLINPKITSCHDFVVIYDGSTVDVSFKVNTVFGEVVIDGL